MKKALVQTLDQSGHTFGQVSSPDDLMKSQGFVHDRIGEMTNDFINSLRKAEVKGFAYELGAGNAFTIAIKTPGRAYAAAGESYGLEADTTLTIAAADADLPRLDLVVITLDPEVDAATALIPFVRLRTSDEFSNNVAPYPPANVSAATELHWNAVASIKTGTPASTPTPPATASNEVPLYLIAVAPGATSIRDADVIDLRDVVYNLRQINDLLGQERIDLANLTRRVQAVEKIANSPIDLSHIFGEIRTLGDILASMQRQIDSLADVPEIRYDNPKVPLTDKAASQVPATGVVISTVPSVQIEIGAKVFFGNTEVPLLPQNFKDGSRNARFSQAAGGTSLHKETTDLTLDNVTQIAADGFTDFVQRASEMPAARSRPAAAARDDSFVELFGGLSANNTSRLADWYTFDVENDTLTQRTPSISLAPSERAAAFPYGDGVHVLLISGSAADSTPPVFKVNAVTSEVVELTGTLPTGVQFFGDLISDGKVLILAVKSVMGDYETDCWEFDTATDTFTLLGVTGSVPDFAIDCADGCYYAQDQFVLVGFLSGITSSGSTRIFDRTTLQWTELSIAAPYGLAADSQAPLARFRMANVNGRPLLVGGLLTKDTDTTKAKVWELTPSSTFGGLLRLATKWTEWDATFAPVQEPGFCSTIGSNGMPSGLAFFFAGQGKYSDAKAKIYSSQQGGLIATTFNGEDAISIADTSTFAQFVVEVFDADWAVAGYLASLVGSWNKSNLKLEVSLNDGANWHEINPDETFLPSDSSDPGRRLLRITMYNLKSSKPVLSQLVEVFDEDGIALETRMVIHYIAPVTAKALYLNRDGSVELSDTVEPSTPNRCLIHKVTPNGSSAPTLKNYINRRRAHIKYTGTSGVGSSTRQFDNELAVPARYVNAWAVTDADNLIYRVGDPALDFDAIVEVDAVASSDHWYVELAS